MVLKHNIPVLVLVVLVPIVYLDSIIYFYLC